VSSAWKSNLAYIRRCTACPNRTSPYIARPSAIITVGAMRFTRRRLTLGGVDVAAPLPFSQRISPRHWLVLDGVCALLIGAATITAVITERHSGPTGRGWEIARVAAVVAVCLLVPLRRAFPRHVLACTAVLLALLVALGLHGPITTIGALALYTVAATNDRRLPVTTVASVIGLVGFGALVAQGGPNWGAAVSGPTIVLVGWLAGENTRTRRAYNEAVLERAAEREQEREERVQRAAADERVRIARELHDVVAHAMSVVAVRAGVARVVLDTQPEEAREALGIIETTSRRALQEMRLIVGVLRQAEEPIAELGPAPGLDDIDQLIEQVSQAGVRVETRTEGTIRALPAGVDLSAYRIIQEGLTNVVRHAGHSTAHLRLRYKPAELEIELTDNGGSPTSTSTSPGGGHGLVGMRERVALYGGQFSAAPTADGFKVLVRLPTDGQRP
jgi:signal transduction histidine kinase